MMSRVDSIGQFYISYGIVLAAAWSAVPVTIMSTVARWFRARRGLMTGIAMAGTGVGTMMMPPLANWLIYQTDWRTSYAAFGLILAVVIVLAAQFLKRSPSVEGLHLSGDKEATDKRGTYTLTRSDFSISEAIHTKQFWLLSIAFASFGYTLQSVMVHVVIHSRGLGLSPSNAASVIAIVGGFGVAGRICLGGFADRQGSKMMLTVLLAMLSLCLFWIAFASRFWAIYTFAVVFGFIYGGVLPLLTTWIAELFGLRTLGAILGVMLLFIALGNAAGPILTGHGFDVLGSYTIPFVVCGGLVAMAALLTIFVKPLSADLVR